jgi:hypothetical protein
MVGEGTQTVGGIALAIGRLNYVLPTAIDRRFKEKLARSRIVGS